MSLQIVIVFSCIYSCIICWWCLNRQKERRAEVPTDHHMSLRFFNFICCNKKRAKENNWWDYCFFMMLLPRVSRDILTKTGPGKKKKQHNIATGHRCAAYVSLLNPLSQTLSLMGGGPEVPPCSILLSSNRAEEVFRGTSPLMWAIHKANYTNRIITMETTSCLCVYPPCVYITDRSLSHTSAHTHARMYTHT